MDRTRMMTYSLIIATGLGATFAINGFEKPVPKSNNKNVKSLNTVTNNVQLCNKINEQDKRIDSLCLELQKLASENKLLMEQVDSLKKVKK